MPASARRLVPVMLDVRERTPAMAPPAGRMAEVLAALSNGIDLASGQPMSHSIRSAYISSRLAEKLHLGGQVESDVLYGSLMADVGCTYTSSRWAKLLQGDELQLAKEIYVLDPRNFRDMFSSVWNAVAPGQAFGKRLWVLGRLFFQFPREVPNAMEERCTRGQEIASSLGFSQGMQDAILYAFERYDGKGKVYGLRSQLIPLTARIVILGQIAEVFATRFGLARAVEAVMERAGGWLDPELAGAFADLAQEPQFRRDMMSDDLTPELLTREPSSSSYWVTDQRLDEIIAAFGTLIDIKSEFTMTHSHAVAVTAEAIGCTLGLGPETTRLIRRAALLHDLGKIGVPNSILDKPGPLSDDEWSLIRKHPDYTERILTKAPLLEPIAPLAAGHHERLDGTGYHRGLRGGELDMATRVIITADVYQALSCDRPYRAALDPVEALRIMECEESDHIDGDCLAALRSLI